MFSFEGANPYKNFQRVAVLFDRSRVVIFLASQGEFFIKRILVLNFDAASGKGYTAFGRKEL